jgi:hypothetical protein
MHSEALEHGADVIARRFDGDAQSTRDRFGAQPFPE